MTRWIEARFLALAAALGLTAAIGCGGPPTPIAPEATPGGAPKIASGPAPRSDYGVLLPSPVLSEEAICKRPDAKPISHEYKGLLRGAKCEQQMYLTMANVATELGVKCVYCHAKKTPGGGDTDLDYPVMTPKKEIANWMTQHLMQAVRPKKAGKYDCSSCHVDEKGNPVAKILGAPRDDGRANEWMTLVMTSQFTNAKGEPLKCRSCHVGTISTPAWTPKVILQTAQIPAHLSP